MNTKSMVTRTFNTTKVEYMAVDVNTGEVFTNVPATLAGTFTDKDGKLNEKQLMKALEKSAYLTYPNYKVVKVTNLTVVETLYGMPEDKFIASAEVLPPRKGN